MGGGEILSLVIVKPKWRGRFTATVKPSNDTSVGSGRNRPPPIADGGSRFQSPDRDRFTVKVKPRRPGAVCDVWSGHSGDLNVGRRETGHAPSLVPNQETKTRTFIYTQI